MKKTLKSILAAALVIIMALSSVTAFAADSDKTLKWQRYDVLYLYDYAGELETGDMIITTPEDSDKFYYIFNAEKSGYYRFVYSAEKPAYLMIAESYGNFSASRVNGGIFCENGAVETIEYYYLEEGQHAVGFSNSYITHIDTPLRIEYCGETVELSYDEEFFRDLVIDPNNIDEKQHCIYLVPTITATLGDGTALVYENDVFDCYYEGEFTEGETELTFTFLGQTETVTATLYYAPHFVKNIEIVNPEKYLTVRRSDSGRVYWENTISGNLAVTLTDGSVKTVPFTDNRACFTDAYGNYHYVTLNYKTDENYESCTLELFLTGYAYQNYECDIKESESEYLFSVFSFDFINTLTEFFNKIFSLFNFFEIF